MQYAICKPIWPRMPMAGQVVTAVTANPADGGSVRLCNMQICNMQIDVRSTCSECLKMWLSKRVNLLSCRQSIGLDAGKPQTSWRKMVPNPSQRCLDAASIGDGARPRQGHRAHQIFDNEIIPFLKIQNQFLVSFCHGNRISHWNVCYFLRIEGKEDIVSISIFLPFVKVRYPVISPFFVTIGLHIA